MKPIRQKLLIEQTDRRLSVFKPIGRQAAPPKGWIYTIRTALKMSLVQFGGRLGITPQSAKEVELRELTETITLKSLREAGNALNMKLVYGFIPKDESLEKMIEKRALEIATEIVERTSQTMKLEDQKNSNKRLTNAIKERAEEIKRTMPKYLWD